MKHQPKEKVKEETTLLVGLSIKKLINVTISTLQSEYIRKSNETTDVRKSNKYKNLYDPLP